MYICVTFIFIVLMTLSYFDAAAEGQAPQKKSRGRSWFG